MPDLTFSVTKARKDWVCAQCGRAIPKGTRYTYVQQRNAGAERRCSRCEPIQLPLPGSDSSPNTPPRKISCPQTSPTPQRADGDLSADNSDSSLNQEP